MKAADRRPACRQPLALARQQRTALPDAASRPARWGSAHGRATGEEPRFSQLLLTKPEIELTIRIIRISIVVNVTTSPPAPPADTPSVVDAALPSGEFETPIRSKELFKERACIYIEHEGMIYALRSTRAGKLILTK